MKITVNDNFYPLMNDTSRYLALLGGAGSGKSWFAAQKCLFRLMGEENMRILFCRKVASSIRNSQFLLFRDLINKYGLQKQFQIAESRMDITYLPNGNQLLSSGLDDTEKLKSLASPTAIWIEEATELSMDDFRQLDLRLRGIKHTYVQIMLSFNPISKKHWLYQLLEVDQRPDTVVHRSTYQDNPYVDESYKRLMEQLAKEDEKYHQVYGKGEWGENRQGLIYHYQTCATAGEVDQTIFGLDFGFNNPTALVQVGIKEERVYVQELLYQTGLTNSDLLTKLERLLPSKRSIIYADSAEPQRIEEIKRAGFNIRPSQKAVGPGIDRVKRCKLLVPLPAPNLLHELDHYQWDTHAQGHYLDSPVKAHDHLMDALRYAIYTHLSDSGERIWGFV